MKHFAKKWSKIFKTAFVKKNYVFSKTQHQKMIEFLLKQN